MSKKQSLENGKTQEQTAITNVAPVGDQAGRIEFDAALSHRGGLRPASYLVTVVMTGAADLLMWGREANGVWGIHAGRYVVPNVNGKIGTALAIGTHHIVVEDVGLYEELFFTTSVVTAASSVKVRPILFSNYGS